MPKIRNVDPVPVTLDLLIPKSIGIVTVSRTVLLWQVSSHCDQGFRFIVLTYTPHTYIATHVPTYPRIHTS